MPVPRILPFVLLSIAGIATARAASFDCAKARTGVEKAVCADPQLSEYDERIAAAYQRALGEWNGAIRGYVRDEQGSPVASAQIVARSIGMGTTRSATTNADGFYYIGGLRPDQYDLSTRRIGFAPQSRTVVNPASSVRLA